VATNPVTNPSRTVIVRPSEEVISERTLTTTGTIITKNSYLLLPSKSSADTLDYTLDYTQWFDGTNDSISGYYIKDISPTSDDYPLTVVKSWNEEKTVSFVLSSGVPSTTYSFVVLIQTTAGYTYYQAVEMIMSDTANSTTPSTFPALPDTTSAIIYVSSDLPTSDPANAGQLWNNGGYIMVSEG
jgi:hypothetical protein